MRGAYHDLVAHDRHPVVALFLEIPPELVDVNVHPMKTEVRFRDAGLVRGLIVGGLKHALASAGHRTATQSAVAVVGRRARVRSRRYRRYRPARHRPACRSAGAAAGFGLAEERGDSRVRAVALAATRHQRG